MRWKQWKGEENSCTYIPLKEEENGEDDSTNDIVYDDKTVEALLDRSQEGIEEKESWANEYLSSFKVHETSFFGTLLSFFEADWFELFCFMIFSKLLKVPCKSQWSYIYHNRENWKKKFSDTILWLFDCKSWPL